MDRATDLEAEKAEMREQAIVRRETIPAERRARAAVEIAAHGIAWCGAEVGATVSAYCAIGAELDPGPLLVRLADTGHPTCLPVLQPKGQPLIFRAWQPGAPLVTRMWGIRQPAPEAAVVEPDVLLVPLLAFDAAGWRLGYGGGFYDRTLARLRALQPVVAIGLAFDEQEVPDVPHGPFDQRLDWLLTPGGPRRVAV